ncbi:unknown [Bacteroides sp. CAG:633]|nr:unknown [Bacteroides sp. CAG:633]
MYFTCGENAIFPAAGVFVSIFRSVFPHSSLLQHDSEILTFRIEEKHSVRREKTMISVPKYLVDERNKQCWRAKQAFYGSQTSNPREPNKCSRGGGQAFFCSERRFFRLLAAYICNLKAVFARFNFYFGSFRKRPCQPIRLNHIILKGKQTKKKFFCHSGFTT